MTHKINIRRLYFGKIHSKNKSTICRAPNPLAEILRALDNVILKTMDLLPFPLTTAMETDSLTELPRPELDAARARIWPS